MSFTLPNEWQERSLGEFAKASGGFGFPPDAQGKAEGDYPFYKVSDMNLRGNERNMQGANNWISESKRKEIKAKTHPAGALIFPKIGATIATNKKRILTQRSIVDNNVMAVVINKTEVCTPEYLRYWFETIHLSNLANSGALPSIPAHRVHATRVLLPPLSEQKKISYVLSTVQQAIEAQEKIIQTTTELKKALMHKLFTEGIRGEPQKETEIGLIPESWEESTLGEITTMHTGGTPSRKTKEFWEGGTIPWVKTGEVNYHSIETTEELITEAGLKGSNTKLFPKGTLLMAMYGQGITRGRVALLGIEAATNQACAAITPRDENQVSTEYLYFYLEFFYEKLRSRGHGANQKNLSMTLLKIFPVVFPDIDSQYMIVTALKIIDAKIDMAVARKNSLQSLFRTLLHALMTAKIRVHSIALNM